MLSRPAVVVHELAQARTALQPGYPVVLLSATGAAGYAGCLWWRLLVAAARAAHPATPSLDVLDCASAPGLAMAALRAGQRLLVLDSACPAFPAVTSAAALLGARVLASRPPALNLAERIPVWRLKRWLAGATE